MSSPFASLVTPAGDSAEPSPTPTFPVASPAAQAAFNALVQKMNKVPDDEPETDPQDDDESNTDESGEDESGEDESGTAAVTETEPEPAPAVKRRARKPRVKKDAEAPVTVPDTHTAPDQTPREVALTHSPDEAWVILREQSVSENQRVKELYSEIESIKSTLEDLTKEYETSLQSFVERDEVIDTLSVALVNLSKGTPGIIGKVRITVIDGEVRIDPA